MRAHSLRTLSYVLEDKVDTCSLLSRKVGLDLNIARELGEERGMPVSRHIAKRQGVYLLTPGGRMWTQPLRLSKG